MYNLTFAVKNNVIVNGALNTNPRFENWKAKQIEAGCTLIEVETDNELYLSQGNLKVVDNEVIIKTDDDYRPDRIANAEQSKAQLLNTCTQYQQGEADPRIDSNFFSLLMASQTVKKMDPAFECPKCDANMMWSDTLWSDYEQRKTDIDNGDIPNLDFSNNGNPPHTFDECRFELN